MPSSSAARWESSPFASNKLGTTSSSNATRRPAESCVSHYFGGCRFCFVRRGADEHSQGEVGGAGSHNGATRAAKPSDDGRSVRLRLAFCKYGLACAGTWVFSPFTAKRRGSPCAPWTFVAMWLVAKATPAVWVVNAEVWSRRRLQRFCGSLGLRRGLRPSRAATGPRPRGSNAPRRPAGRIAGLVVVYRGMDAAVRGSSRARPSRGSRLCLVAFPRTHEAALGRAPARRRRRRGHTSRYCVRGLGGHDPEPHLLNIVT